MRIYRSLSGLSPDFGPSALTIGNFDGVHYGHRRILRRLKALSDERGWKPSVLTFDPHPTRVVAPDRSPKLLTTPERRAELMAPEGVEQVLILPFTHELAAMSAEDFIRILLVKQLGARAILVGDNFRFGCRQAGDVEMLRRLGGQFGLETEIVPAVRCRGMVVSSSAIRDLILEGRIARAARFLQEPYGLEGEVAKGRGIGSKQTVPTLNLITSAEVIPAPGVYITRTRPLDRVGEWNSITNIGYRPTFGASNELSIETFILDPFEGDAPQKIRIGFLARLRDERRFDSPEALRAQILKDVRVTQNYFRRVKNLV
jgi:riboflavin kinase / FMN adenylyltransferase